ncbi:MAG: ATP-dependent zinc metalloprotease FtsH [Verrucomicrobia bacterium]|nr:ATP-dependent zinc metalloprotease FtsH [Verrucomicrobiota bacterium]
MKKEPRITLPLKKPAKVDRQGPQWRFFIIYFLVTLLVLWGWQELFERVSVRTIPYSEFKNYLARHEVTEAIIKENEIEGRIVPKPANGSPPAAEASPSPGETEHAEQPKATPKEGAPFIFRTERVEDPQLVSELQAAGVKFAAQRPGFLSQLLGAWILPIAIIFIFWSLLARRMGAAGQSIFSVGKSGARLVADSDTKVTFGDVAGCDEAKFELKEVVDFLKSPKQYEELGARIPKGVLLVGPPGTGKTLLARAVAGEAKVPFFSISGSDFVEMFVGVGAARVRDLFQQAKSHAPCIIFIDELDAIGRQRGVHVGAVNDEREQTLNALLVQMDGFEPNAGVIILAATNRPEVLDRALLRPGRFDRQVVVDAPDLDGREAILKVHARDKKLSTDVDLRRIAAATAGLSGADLANILNEAALLAARRHGRNITQKDLEDAIEKVVAGPERRSRRLNEEEKRRVAYHEVGHALMAAYNPDTDPVHKISIVPRGRTALGYTMQLPSEDQFLLTRTELMHRIEVLLGGRAAEEVVFGEVSTGAQNDLERATAMARQMVALYGMSERVGLPNCAQRQPAFLDGQGFQIQRDCSEETAKVIDEEVRKLLALAYQKANETLSVHRDQLERVTAELLKSETIDGPTFYKLLGKEVPAVKEPVALKTAAAEGQ